MNRFIVLFVVLGCLITAALFGRLAGGQNGSIPRKILNEHSATIAQVDAWIVENNLNNQGGVILYDEDFDLGVYLKTLQIGVLPYLEEEGGLRGEVEVIMEQISCEVE